MTAGEAMLEAGRPAGRMLASLPERLAGGGSIQALFHALGAELEEIERSLDLLLRARWPDHCDPAALDRLASLVGVRRADKEDDLELRRRLRATVTGALDGPGDAASLRRMIFSALGPGAEIEENPARGRRAAAVVLMGEAIAVENLGLDEATCWVSVVLRHDAADLKVSVAESGAWARLAGEARGGSHFRFDSRGGAWLNGEPCGERVERSAAFLLPRGRSSVVVSESRGRFDHSKFDEARMSSPGAGLADVEVRWEERLPATVRISLPAARGRGASATSLQSETARAVAQVRSAGIRVLMDLREEFSEPGSAGREPSLSIRGGCSAAESHEMRDEVTSQAELRLEEQAEAGREDAAIPAGRFGAGKFDAQDSRFV